MSALAVVEGLIAGVWLGTYLFTTLVVTPALKQLPLTDAERIRTRSVIGRRYGRLALPLLLLWLVVLLAQGLSAETGMRLGLLLVLVALSALHAYWLGTRMQRVATEELASGRARAGERTHLQRRSAWLTSGGLLVSLTLALLSLTQGV